MWATNIGYSLVPIFCYLFCIVFKGYIIGLAISRSLAEIVQFLLLLYFKNKK